MTFSLRLRLSAMMFLQYFVLGAWLVTFPTFLMAAPHEGGMYLTGKQVGLLYSTMAIAGLAAPFLAGLLADRLFPAQWVLAVLHLSGVIVLFSTWVYVEQRQTELVA